MAHLLGRLLPNPCKPAFATQMLNIAVAAEWTEERLRQTLVGHGINPDLWRGPKTAKDLLRELTLGESTLKGCPGEEKLLRVVRVVTVHIPHAHDAGLELVEESQVFSQGNTCAAHERVRLRPLSEKLLPREDACAGALRAVQEELGVEAPQGTRVAMLGHRVEAAVSLSYDGLRSEYHVDHVEVDLARAGIALPAGRFQTSERHGGSEGGAIVHHWAWVCRSGLPA